ncbi:conserved hypothetical protein [Thiomonas arsenitoxydans]|uniref:EAL domain-containing protein n=1 Tax=Thiomonas arsenitoxydans (strain DSM 22701 / CIP 110005 / 3As) TaxID=426114 RepID=D6CV69_THIA3|nr:MULTISPECIES: EAL domain-containing protein [Thiomonas]CQR45379.1 conserved hypothetical protein [Thiomonas sp. CB3]OZB70216.1 MAG: diguanylate phosphodiesterase [Thiomonas sp. 13-64-67]CAZ89188.1 conserved hypothetical protein; putative EAL domain [Thiomonas arsenitoxydans]CQR34547.1 conserved hypothetical protein [Thiomonas arsenitoxydans]CQR34946.1 conserved hypothetical protein [Thiomonas arsenitoxydans]
MNINSLAATGCKLCFDSPPLDFDFTMAFQPIVDSRSGTIFAHEALARGLQGEPASTIFEKVNDDNRYRFDQTCRVKAVALAARLGLKGYLSINFLPNAVYKPELCIRATLAAAEQYSFPPDRLLFEVTESERVEDVGHLKSIINDYKSRGFLTAIDDFGAGFAGLNLLAELQTDIVKLDMALVRNVNEDRIKASIIRGVIQTCIDLNIRVIAEGVETREEYLCLERMGINLFQGFYFSRPVFEGLGQIDPNLFSHALG